MKGEINRDWYCSADAIEEHRSTKFCGYGSIVDGDKCDNFPKCRNRHRKWPTPEQFKGEYGEEYPDEGIGYWKYRNSTIWKCDFYGDFKSYIAPTIEEAAEQKHQIFVCACTPWGKPPNDWRPE